MLNTYGINPNKLKLIIVKNSDEIKRENPPKLFLNDRVIWILIICFGIIII